MKLPDGFRLAYNRLDHPWEHPVDGVPYIFAAHETRALPEEIAGFLRAHSLFKYEYVMNTGTRAIALDDEPEFEQPYEGEMPIELLDRSVDDNYLQKPTESGQKSHAETIPVVGYQADVRRSS